MEVALIKLAELRQRQGTSDLAAFQRAYPGAFLLAMGFLSAELIRARRAATQSPGARGDPTTAISIGASPKHDASAEHPLAGYAFFIRAGRRQAPVLIGRGQQCDLTVPERSISDEHCRIEITDQGVVAVDLGSTNGTSVNLQRLRAEEPAMLADEDILTLGRYSFQLFTPRSMYTELALLAELDR
jgi:hypothetical protein